MNAFYRVTGNFPDGSCECIKTGEPAVHHADMLRRGALLVVTAKVEDQVPNVWRDAK